VAAAFHACTGFRVVVLYPEGLISARQEHQLTAWGGRAHALALAGRFDDCQAQVKRALGDTALTARHALGSANSISLGRLLPQVAYHYWAALRFRRERGFEPGFLVPTGNLGNALACVVARAMGAPIGRIVCCLNANRVLADFLERGAYEPRPSVETIANAMDVGAPSNLERLRWMYPDLRELRARVEAVSYDDEAIRAAIVAAHARYGTIVCPHTATAMAELMRRRSLGDAAPWIVVATAHPAKFETVIEPLLGRTLEVPASLRAILARPARKRRLQAGYAALVAALDELDALP
jgi:threonine synthase